MMIKHLPIWGLSLLLSLGLHAQEPLFRQNKVKLIGMKQLDGQGLLLVQKSAKPCHVLLQRIDAAGQSAWMTDLPVPDLGGYHFNKVQIHFDRETLFWVDQLDQHAELSLLSMADGQILKQHIPLPLSLQLESDPVSLGVGPEGLQLIVQREQQIYAQHLDSSGAGQARELLTVDPLFKVSSILVHGIRHGQVFASGYTVKPDHSALRICLLRSDLRSGDTMMRTKELTLNHMSFTYNSTVDHRLFSVIPAKDGYYLLGKLDHAFAKTYPTTKLTEAFVGVWLAKVDADLNLLFFSEIPFQHFQGYVGKNEVTRAAVLSIHEDATQSIILNIQELQEVFYGNKYAITLDREGVHRAISGGKDQYHFFEYNSRGLHSAARNSHIRLINDDWGYYSTSSLHMLRYISGLHSPMIAHISHMAERTFMDLGEMIYQVGRLNGRPVLLEYLNRKGGQFSIYAF